MKMWFYQRIMIHYGYSYAVYVLLFLAGFIAIIALESPVDARHVSTSAPNVSTSAPIASKTAGFVSVSAPIAQTLSSSTSASQLILNEIMASNATIVEDEDGDLVTGLRYIIQAVNRCI